MNKKDLSTLHSNHCQMEKVKVQLGKGEETRYLVHFSLAPGELLALINSLTESPSPVSADIAAFLRNAGARAGIIA